VYWSDQTYGMTIDGRPVDLHAFGFIDITNLMVGKLRLWNVVIVTDKPGTITIDHSGEIAGGSPGRNERTDLHYTIRGDIYAPDRHDDISSQ
jgi:hypothetical protein